MGGRGEESVYSRVAAPRDPQGRDTAHQHLETVAKEEEHVTHTAVLPVEYTRTARQILGFILEVRITGEVLVPTSKAI